MSPRISDKILDLILGKENEQSEKSIDELLEKLKWYRDTWENQKRVFLIDIYLLLTIAGLNVWGKKLEKS